MINALVLGGDDFKAEASIRATGFADGGHPKVNRIIMETKLLLPVGVLAELASGKYNPVSSQISVLSDEGSTPDYILMPRLLVQTLWICVTTRSAECPKQAFLLSLRLRLQNLGKVAHVGRS